MKKLAMAALGLSTALSAASATAGHNYLHFGAGAVLADEEDLDFGPSVQIGFGTQMSDHFDVEVFAAYSDLDVDSNSGCTNCEYERLGLGVDFLGYISRDQSINWYGIAGLSGARTEFVGTTSYAPSMEFGGGFKKALNENLDLRADLRYRFDIHRGDEGLDDDIFYEWVLHLGLAVPLGSSDYTPAAAPAPAPAPVSAEPEPIYLPGVTFPLDSAQLTANARTTLDGVIDILNDQPELSIEIIGHADDTGPSDYNQELSERRAAAVKEYFVENGISADRFGTAGAGEIEPVASNTTDDGRQRNRRVDFIIR